MLNLVKSIVADPDVTLVPIALAVERTTIAKRLWRGVAEDGTEFGFDLAAPLKHGDTIFQSARARYFIQQQPEAVVEIALSIPPSAAAGIAWAIGNLHLELCAEPTRLLAPDEPAVRQLLGRLKVEYTATTAVFRPGRFARGNPANPSAHELGPSHQH